MSDEVFRAKPEKVVRLDRKVVFGSMVAVVIALILLLPAVQRGKTTGAQATVKMESSKPGEMVSLLPESYHALRPDPTATPTVIRHYYGRGQEDEMAKLRMKLLAERLAIADKARKAGVAFAVSVDTAGK